MATFNAPDVTAKANTAKSIHAGVNAVLTTYTFAETASGNQTVNMYPLPAGGRVFGLTLTNNTLGTGTGSQVAVKDSLGNAYIATSQASGVYSLSPSHGAHAKRLTASANIQVQLSNFVAGTGTSAPVFSLSMLYTAEEEGD